MPQKQWTLLNLSGLAFSLCSLERSFRSLVVISSVCEWFLCSTLRDSVGAMLVRGNQEDILGLHQDTPLIPLSV